MLRHTLECQLPVEIVFNGEFEMDAKTCDKFQVLLSAISPASSEPCNAFTPPAAAILYVMPFKQ